MELFNQTLQAGFHFLISGLCILWMIPHVSHKLNAALIILMQSIGSALCVVALFLLITGMVEGGFLWR